MAIAEFTENIINSNDTNNATCAILLDLSKAFDSVNREILLFKLSKCGIRGNMLKLLKSYLNNRSQYVCGGSNRSNLVDVDVGVPQGSVLGPLLFIVHINDMQFCTSMKVLNFADDTLFYMKFKNKNNMEIKLNNELDKIYSWLNNNHLRVNTSKTKYMVFAPNLKIWKGLSLNISIGQAMLEQVSQYKYLGLVIDTKLTWIPHIKHLSSKLSRTLGIMYRTRHYLNKQSLYLIFHSLFLSHIKYGILCWARASKTALQPLIVLFNRAIKCIHYCHFKRKHHTSTDSKQFITHYRHFQIRTG